MKAKAISMAALLTGLGLMSSNASANSTTAECIPWPGGGQICKVFACDIQIDIVPVNNNNPNTGLTLTSGATAVFNPVPVGSYDFLTLLFSGTGVVAGSTGDGLVTLRYATGPDDNFLSWDWRSTGPTIVGSALPVLTNPVDFTLSSTQVLSEAVGLPNSVLFSQDFPVDPTRQLISIGLGAGDFTDATGFTAQITTYASLLATVPEPATCSVILAATCVMSVRRRRA